MLLYGPKKEKQKYTIMLVAISLKIRIKIGFNALNSPAEYRTIANMFGVWQSTKFSILKLIWLHLYILHMNFGLLLRCCHDCHEDVMEYYNNYKGLDSIIFIVFVNWYWIHYKIYINMYVCLCLNYSVIFPSDIVPSFGSPWLSSNSHI